MNYLVIILLVFVLVRGKNESLNNLLSSITVEDALPLLQMLGINSDHLQMISNLLPNFLNGELDLPTIIKNLAPLIATLGQKKQSSDNTTSEGGIEDIKDFAPQQIIEGMQDYFA